MFVPMLSAYADSVASSGTSVLINQFPGEEPSVEAMLEFLRENTPKVNAAFGFDLRGQLPPHLISLSKMDDLSGFSEVTEATPTVAGIKHNISVRQAIRANVVRSETLAAAKVERQNSLAQSIDISMQRTAPLRLSRLKATHRLPTTSDTYDGIGMWKEIVALATSTGMHDERVDHDRVVERMRDEHLPDGCCIDDFTDKVNDMIRNHAPFMERPFADDQGLAKFIIRLMPACNAPEGRDVLRRLQHESRLDSRNAIQECVRIVKESQRSDVRRVVASAARWAKPPIESLARDDRALKAATDAARAALAAARANPKGGGGKPKPGGPANGGAHLGDNQWCWEKTCHFDHKDACWRAPWFKGDESIPNPSRGHPWIRARSDPKRIDRLNADKQANATRLKVPCFRLKVQPKRVAAAAAIAVEASPAAAGAGVPGAACAQCESDSFSGLEAFQFYPGGCASLAAEEVCAPAPSPALPADQCADISDDDALVDPSAFDQCAACVSDEPAVVSAAGAWDDEGTASDVERHFAQQTAAHAALDSVHSHFVGVAEASTSQPPIPQYPVCAHPSSAPPAASVDQSPPADPPTTPSPVAMGEACDTPWTYTQIRTAVDALRPADPISAIRRVLKGAGLTPHVSPAVGGIHRRSRIHIIAEARQSLGLPPLPDHLMQPRSASSTPTLMTPASLFTNVSLVDQPAFASPTVPSDDEQPAALAAPSVRVQATVDAVQAPSAAIKAERTPPAPSASAPSTAPAETEFVLRPAAPARSPPSIDQWLALLSIPMLVLFAAFIASVCFGSTAAVAYASGAVVAPQLTLAAHRPAYCASITHLHALPASHPVHCFFAVCFLLLYAQAMIESRPWDALSYATGVVRRLLVGGVQRIRAAPGLGRRVTRAIRAVLFGAVICGIAAMVAPAAGQEITAVAASRIESFLVKSHSLGLSTSESHAFAQKYLFETTNVSFCHHMGLLPRSDALELAESLNIPLSIVPMALNANRSDVRARAKAHGLTIADSGAGVNGWSSLKYAVPGTVHPNHTIRISTANGLITPPYKFAVDLPVSRSDGRIVTLRLRENVLLPDSEHNLVSLGRLGSEMGASTLIAPPDQGSRIFLADGTQIPLLNVGVLVFPTPDAVPRSMPATAPAGVSFDNVSHGIRFENIDGPVVHGKEGQAPRQFKMIHDRWNHSSYDILRHLPHVLADAPSAWARNGMPKSRCSCDSCLRGSADALPSFAHAPNITEPGRLVSYDIWQSPVPHVHGGQRYVIGFHDHYSHLDYFCLLHSKSDAPQAIKKFYAFAKSHGVTCCWFNTDNAGELSGHSVKAWALEQGVRITTCCPDVPRQNHVIEQRWRYYGNKTRVLLAAAAPAGAECFPVSHWWYFFRHAMHVSWATPLVQHGTPLETAWSRFTGRKPCGRQIRKPGTLCYYKVMHPAHKLCMRARRAVVLGRADDQPGYLVRDLSDATLHVTPHVRFCEHFNPGLNARQLPNEPALDAIWPPIDAARPDAPIAPPAVVPPDPPAPFADIPTDDTHTADSDDDAALPNPNLISGRLAGRPNRQVPPNRFVPGTSAVSTLFGLPATGNYYLYLGSNAPREHDLSSALRNLTAVPCVCVDVVIGGYQHDLSHPEVAASALAAALSARCLGVLVSVPCETWSAVRSVQAHGALSNSKPLRDCDHPLGFADDTGNVPERVLSANRIVDCAAACMEACYSHGGFFIAETPVGRGKCAPAAFRIPGRDKHINQFQHPSIAALRAATNASLLQFDQCRTHDVPSECPQKSTELMCSPNAWTAVSERFAPLICCHPPNTHASMTGLGADGLPNSSQWKRYSPTMNRLLAEAMVDSTKAVAGGASAAHGVDPLSDWTSYLSQGTSFVDRPPSPPLCSALVRSVADSLSSSACFRSQLYRTGIDSQVFLAPRAVDYDNPSFDQATNPANPDCAAWLEACQRELQNMEDNNVAEPALEDTLPTWCAEKRFASEVVNLLWVLKKKYMDGVFERCKARIVYDGRVQKTKFASATGSVLDTFAPTVRHTTQKLLAARAVSLGGPRCKLSSRAYIEKLQDALPKPLSSYPTYDTPCSPHILKHYETALDRRQDVDPALAKSYPVKIGRLIYAMPASRVDCCFAIGVLSRCLTFPTADMDAEADRCIAYLAQHPSDGPSYDPSESKRGLVGYVDSDWGVSNSTTGYAILYCGAVVAYGSKRQRSIALSSTEAEIMAASHAGAEIIYLRGLLREMGADVTEPTILYVDNKGAVELSRDAKSCQRSRHIERRYLKIREWVAMGEIRVEYVATAQNPADILTKPVDATTFRRHTTTLMGPATCTPPACPTVRQRTFDVEAAYLKGEFESHQTLYARPPRGARYYVRGVPVIWRLRVPLYGEADAGRLWNRTFVRFLTGPIDGGGGGWSQSGYDPCYFFKILHDGSRIDMALYVDDGYVIDSGSPLADAELARLHDRFTIAIKHAKFFLGNNVSIGAP